MRRPHLLAAGLAAVLALGGVPAHAQPKVQLNGTMGTRSALLVIDGIPHAVQVGTTVQGVRLVSLEEGRAVVEVGGQRLALALGAAPGRIAAQDGGGAARQIILTAGSGGHFMAQGAINGRATNFMIDTGATDVAISQVEADRLGLRYASGRRMITHTANGTAPAWLIQLSSVRVADVEVYNVSAVVIPSDMPHVLLGNSFLSRFQMKRDNEQMTLEQRY